MSGSLKEIETIIIGAGPAGLMAASALPGSALVLEKKPEAGLKLLISGSGQCNLTHSGANEELLTHFGNKSRFLKSSIYSFSNSEVSVFFESKNVPLVTREDGKVFPASFSSRDILNCLLNAVRSAGNRIEYKSAVKRIKKSDNCFSVETDSASYRCSSLIIATGGKSWPDTGSSGDGYTLAESLGHPVVKPEPALAPVKIKNHRLAGLSGISFQDISISLWRGGKKADDFTGDMLITHNGLSGPAILDNSRYLRAGDILKISFFKLPENMAVFRDRIRNAGKQSVKKFLQGFNLPGRLLDHIISMAMTSADKNCADADSTEIKQLFAYITAYPAEIASKGGFDTAMVTAGGIDTLFVDPRTMESKIHSGLFFAGEVLDVDGDSGGYNIQAAFSTGYKAAETIKKGRPR